MSKAYSAKIESLAKSIFYIDCDTTDSLMKLAGAEPELSEEQAEALVDFLANNEKLKSLGLHDNTYIVGGAIRDALLGLKPKDIDLVIDTKAVDENPPVGMRRSKEGGKPVPWTLLFGRAIGEELGMSGSSIIEDNKLVVHVGPLSEDYFWNPLTHKKDMEHGVDLIGAKIEIVSARAETYDKKKGQPEVIPGTLEEDLKRRDFGINAMALSLNNASEGLNKDKIIDKIIDATGAGTDELRKRLRDVYRPGKGQMSPRKACLLKTPLDPYKTFEDDPSRILRAVRFALKYGCEIEEETRKAMAVQAHFLKEYSWNNINIILIEKILFQPYGEKALHMMKSLGILDVLADMFKAIKGMKTDFNTRLDNNDIPRDHPILLDLVSMGVEDLRVPAASKGITQQHRRKMKKILEQDPESDVVPRAAKLPVRLDQIAKETNLGYAELREIARDFIIDNPEKSNEEILNLMRSELLISEASNSRIIKIASMAPENVHIIANKLGIDWDNNPNFMRFTRELTEKEHLDDMEPNELRIIVNALKAGEYCYFEINNEINSLDLSGDIYVFDFDDTLMWNPDWHSEVETDQEGFVVAPGGSASVKVALDFINNFKEKVKEDYEGSLPNKLELKKVIVDILELGKKDQVVFQLVADDGLNISISDIKNMFSSRTLSYAKIDTRGRYISLPAVTDDKDYYADANTLGALGVNEEIFNIYNEKVDNAIVLTARSNVPGMKDGVLEKIKEQGGRPPLAVFTKPLRGPSGGLYKGSVLSMIASIPSVNNVIFFDDNKKYIDAVQDAKKSLPDDVAQKIKTNIVSTINKPASRIESNKRLIKLANYLNAVGLTDEANQVYSIISKASQEFNKEDIMGPIMGVLGLIKKLEKTNKLPEGLSPPSKEELIDEARRAHKLGINPIEVILQWIDRLQGREVRGLDYNRKKQAAERINYLIQSLNLHKYDLEEVNIENIDKISLSELTDRKDVAEDTAQKVKRMNSGLIIRIPATRAEVDAAIGDWEPPEGFEMIMEDRFHVTIISPQTVSNFKADLSDGAYEELRREIENIELPSQVALVGGKENIGLATRSEKKTFALAVENQQDFEKYRKKVIDEISKALKPLGRRVPNPMTWWFNRADPDIDRFFHVSIANNKGGWPTLSVPDVNKSDFTK